MEKKKQVRRSVEERVAEIDKKIEGHKANIKTLEAKKKALLAPKKRQRPMGKAAFIEAVTEAGISFEEALQKITKSK